MVNLNLSVSVCANTKTHTHIPTSNYEQMHCLYLQRFSRSFLAWHPTSSFFLQHKAKTSFWWKTIHPFKMLSTTHRMGRIHFFLCNSQELQPKITVTLSTVTVIMNHLHSIWFLHQHCFPTEDEQSPRAPCPLNVLTCVMGISSSGKHCPYQASAGTEESKHC